MLQGVIAALNGPSGRTLPGPGAPAGTAPPGTVNVDPRGQWNNNNNNNNIQWPSNNNINNNRNSQRDPTITQPNAAQQAMDDLFQQWLKTAKGQIPNTVSQGEQGMVQGALQQAAGQMGNAAQQALVNQLMQAAFGAANNGGRKEVELDPQEGHKRLRG